MLKQKAHSLSLMTAVACTLILTAACAKKPKSESESDPNAVGGSPSDRYLYVSSGGCYVGTLTGEPASKTIARVNLTTGNVDSTVIDYNSQFAGDIPVGVVHADSSYMYVAVENAAGRRIDKVSKSDGSAQTHILNNTALSAQLRKMVETSDGSLLVAKTSAIEKFSAGKARLTAGANPWVNAPAGSCVTSTSIMSMLELPNGNIAYINAAASQNRIGIITGTTGYLTTADCKSAQAAPNTNAYPTAIVYIAAAKQFLVSYASATAGYDYIYAYDYDESTNVISGAQVAYNNPAVIRGASAMVYDSQTGYVYISNGSTTLNNSIERFTYDSATKTLTRDASVSFSMPTVYHKCISSMTVF